LCSARLYQVEPQGNEHDGEDRRDDQARHHGGGIADVGARPAIHAGDLIGIPDAAFLRDVAYPAVREGAVLPESRLARFRTPGSVLLTLAGFASLLYALFGSDLGTTKVLLFMGLGALLIFFGRTPRSRKS